MRARTGFHFCLALFSFLAGSASGVTANFQGPSVTKDATVYSNATGDNGGGGQVNFAGRTLAHGIRRLLIRFDVSSIPTNAVVSAVSLQLIIHDVPSVASPTPQSLHKVSQAWVEGTALNTGAGGAPIAGASSWNSRGTSTWTTAGGDYAVSPSATATVGVIVPDTVTWTSGGLLADVQSFVSNPALNFGWILIGDESTTQTARGFNSANNPTVLEQPILTVTYAVPLTAAESWSLYE